MNHQKVSLNHHYHKTPLKHHESLHYSHVFVMKKTPKCPRLKKALIVAFLLGFSPDHGKITHFSWVFPASLRSLRSPWFPVVPRWFPGSAAAAASTNASRRTRASCRVAKTRRDNMISVVRWRIYLCVCRVIYIYAY